MNRAEAAAIARAARAAKAPSMTDRFWSKVDRRAEDECWPWKASVRRKDEGYGAFWMNGRHHPAPRVALELSGVPLTAGLQTLHSCDNPNCCNPGHLSLGTGKQNAEEKVQRHRHCFGERNGNATLTEAAVREIKKAKPAETRNARQIGVALAKRHGVTPEHIGSIWRGRAWKHA